MLTQGKIRNLYHLQRDKGYRFKGFRDPVLELVTEAITDSGKSLNSISEKCGVSTNCMRSWMNGDTKRPQHITVRFVLNAMGFDLQVVPLKGW